MDEPSAASVRADGLQLLGQCRETVSMARKFGKWTNSSPPTGKIGTLWVCGSCMSDLTVSAADVVAGVKSVKIDGCIVIAGGTVSPELSTTSSLALILWAYRQLGLSC